jgi:TonB family protein
MVSQGKNNDLPDKDTLRRYLEGKLPPEEAHRIEKLILNNPLYQDALDGLETLSEEELDQDLKDISHQIRKKTQTASKGTKINFYRIAAAISVLAVFSYIIIYTTSRVGEVSKNETLSQKQQIQDEEGEQVPAEALVVETDTAFRSVDTDDLQNQQPETRTREKDGTEQEDDIIDADPLKEISEERVDTPTPQESREVIAVVAAEKLQEETADPEIGDAYFHEKEEESREEATLAEAEDSEFGEKKAELSLVDQELDREIQDPRSAVARTDEEKLMDMQDKDLESLSHEQEAMVAKSSGQPAPELNDYQESDRVKGRENKMARKVDSQAAKVPEAANEPLANAEISAEGILKPVPVDGYEIYAEYISENQEYPAKAIELKIEGTVILRFIINKDSIPDKIRIVQSLSPGCDREARRLLREGPKWIPVYMDGDLNEFELEYNILFKLED